VKFVDFSCAISETYRFEPGVFESLHPIYFGHFRVEALAAKLAVSVSPGAVVDDVIAWCDLATNVATDLLASGELGWIHFH
jgi:hypothetical protein